MVLGALKKEKAIANNNLPIPPTAYAGMFSRLTLLMVLKTNYPQYNSCFLSLCRIPIYIYIYTCIYIYNRERER